MTTETSPPRSRLFATPVIAGAAPVLLGAACALAGLALSQLDLRWVLYVLAALALLLLVVAVHDRERLLSTALVLSLQADVSLRFAYGYADSQGLAFSLTTFLGAALAVWLIAVGAIGGQHKFRWAGRLAVPVAAYFATSLLACLASEESFIGLTQILIQIQFYFAYLLALNFVRSESQLRRVLDLLLLTLVIQSLIYFIQSALGITFTLTGEVLDEIDALPRPGGTVATSPGGFSAFVVPLLTLAAARYVTAERPAEVRWAGLASLLGIFAITLTFTRAAWAAALLGLGWLALVAWRRGALNLRRVAPIAVAACVASLVLSPMIAARLGESSFESAYKERLGLMRMALRVIASEPLLGVGPGAYDYSFKAYLTPEFSNQWIYTVHNVYLLRTAETGIPGGIALGLLLVLGFRQALRLTRARAETVRVAAIGWSAGLLGFAWMMYWNILRGQTYNALFWFLLGLMEAAEALPVVRRGSLGGDREERGGSRRQLVRADVGG